jgi:uncharacterized protein (DUF433 family)
MRSVSTPSNERSTVVKYLPAYTIAEAARFLSMPSPTLRSWFAGIKGHFKSVIRWEEPRDHRLSFANLVEAHVLRALRTKHGISMPDVRTAIRYVEDREGIDRLLLDPRLRAAAGRLFLQKYADLIELAPSAQHVIEKALEQYLVAVVQDPQGVPIKLYPWIPDPLAGPRTSVLIDPRVSFGRPITAIRGITTAVLADQFDAGATIDELAEDYALPAQAIEDALAFERAA